MNQIYKKEEFIITQVFKGNRREFIVINLKKKDKEGFNKAHTHLKSFNMSKYIINLVRKGKINNGLSVYLLVSLMRFSENERYQQKVEDLVEVKKDRRKQKYKNKIGRAH